MSHFLRIHSRWLALIWKYLSVEKTANYSCSQICNYKLCKKVCKRGFLLFWKVWKMYIRQIATAAMILIIIIVIVSDWFKAVQGLMSCAVASSMLALIIGLISLCWTCKGCNSNQATGAFANLTCKSYVHEYGNIIEFYNKPPGTLRITSS